MAKNSILRHGFKADAERKAIDYREKLELHACDPICAFILADYLKVPVYTPSDLPLDARYNDDFYKGTFGQEWSALETITDAGNRIIIHNPYRSNARKQSDAMHELAHIICNHPKAAQVYNVPLPIGLPEYNVVQEEEAKCLGATLQLSKPCLLWARKRSMSFEEVAQHFNASQEMVSYRINMLGLRRNWN